jgi:GSH-dependent disulfide-bond oxidoreductase
MIQVYAFATPNSVKVPVALEEVGLPYELRSVNVKKGEQKLASFTAINHNAKVPVLHDPHGPDGAPFTLSESAAILVYLAEKTGRLLPAHGAGRARVFEQLFFHASGLGPAFGQAGFFQKQAPEQIPLAISRFRNEAERTLSVLDETLAQSEFVAGADFSIADIAHFGWLWRREFACIELSKTWHVARWYKQVSTRPAVLKGVERVSALTVQS